MSKDDKLWRAASMLVADSNLAILTTADASGHPHAAWMNVMVDSAMDKVISITAPTTQKIANLKENPYAEWMFASKSLESMTYLSGPTEIVTDDEAEKYWHSMPGKSKAYYRNYCAADDPKEFSVFCTTVEKVVYCRPPGYRKTLVYEL